MRWRTRWDGMSCSGPASTRRTPPRGASCWRTNSPTWSSNPRGPLPARRQGARWRYSGRWFSKELWRTPRHERCNVYSDQCGLYGWKLSDKGKKDPYHAIAYLFTPQSPHKRTLIHCDYLISLVNFMSLADSIGPTEFNKRVAAF